MRHAVGRAALGALELFFLELVDEIHGGQECAAVGREGINLQFSRVIFNFDLPWNPMDVEQRTGRIHRYCQKDTAQAYNQVLSDTIEGRIFLLLTDKLNDIARTLGKVDEHGNVTEDLHGQVPGQLNDRLSYDQLYREAQKNVRI